MELKEGYNGITVPKEFYNKIIDEETKEAISNSKKIREMLDEIYDNEQVETSVNYTGTDEGAIKNINQIHAIYRDCPVYESEKDAYDNLPQYIPTSTFAPPDKYHLVREVPTIKIRYHKELCPELIEMEKIDKGDFIDLRAAENVFMWQGDFKLISLGISIQLPPGYHAEVVPRSSTYKNFGIIMSNSIGIIDESYCGDNDIWKFPAIAMRDTEIKVNDRICQFRIVKNRDINIEVVDKLGNEDRGGIGSTGKN